VINWTTSENADSRVDYGTTTGYGASVSNATLSLNHSIIVPELTRNTLYHFRVLSRDAAGNAANSSDATLRPVTIVPSRPR